MKIINPFFFKLVVFNFKVVFKFYVLNFVYDYLMRPASRSDMSSAPSHGLRNYFNSRVLRGIIVK